MNRPNIKKYLKDHAFENGFYESDLYQKLLSADRYIDHLLSTSDSDKSSFVSPIIIAEQSGATVCDHSDYWDVTDQSGSIEYFECKKCGKHF